MSQRIAFIGAGNMSSAIIGGMVESGYPADAIIVSNPSISKLDKLSESYSVLTTSSNLEACESADIIILGVKPWVIMPVCKEIKTAAIGKPVISLAAGITTDAMSTVLSESLIARAMPNTPCLVKQGAVGLFGPELSAEQKSFIESLFSPIAYTAWVELEEHINVITTLSGSGPAFYFFLSEALTEVGIELGLPADVAQKLVEHTAAGAGAMLMADAELDAKALREKVTSPNGTTFAATEYFEQQGMRKIIKEGVRAGVTRGEQLARGE